MVIPEGDWFCPACNHKKLLTSLTEKLTELDSLLKKTEAERRRKERLAFIQKGLSKTLPSAQKQKDANKKEPEFSSDESSSDTDSEDEVLLPRRCRTKNPIKYNTEEYDSMMNKALQGDIKYQVKDAPPPAISDESEESEEDESEKASPGKPRAGQGKGKNIDNCSEESEEDSDESAEKKPKPIKMNINKMKGGKKKRKKLTTLEGSDESGDGDSGSDFKLSEELSDDGDEFIDDGSGSDSEEYNYRGKKKKGGRGGGEPSRRSTRARRNRLDDDFVVDGSDSEDYAPKKKKSKWASETSESERYVIKHPIYLCNKI